MTTLLEGYGAKVIVCPTIEIRELENYDRLDEALDHLYGYDWLIFTSTNGVEFFLKRLLARGLKIEDLDEIKSAPSANEPPTNFTTHTSTSISFLRNQPRKACLPRSASLSAAKNICAGSTSCCRAHSRSRTLAQSTGTSRRARRCRHRVPNRRSREFDRGRLSAMLAGSGDCIAFTSPSTIKNLAKLFDTTTSEKSSPAS